MRLGFRQDSSITLSNVVGLNGLRRQRVAPSLIAIRRKSGLAASKLEKAYPEMAISGTVGRTIVKYPDRLEAAHVRHENIDNHQVEGRIVEREEAAGAAIGDRNLKAIPLEPGANGEADVWIVVDDQNTPHDGFSRRNYAFN